MTTYTNPFFGSLWYTCLLFAFTLLLIPFQRSYDLVSDNPFNSLYISCSQLAVRLVIRDEVGVDISVPRCLPSVTHAPFCYWYPFYYLYSPIMDIGPDVVVPPSYE